MSRIQLTANYQLKNIAEGWTEEHYLTFRIFDSKVSLDCSDDLKALDEKDNRGYLEVFTKYAKGQFVGGKVLVDNETVDAETDDIDGLPSAIVSDIFELISRSKFADPKAGTN